MFAGAAREAVFSKPEVIRRINADFVPVALKAGLVNNPPGDEEGRLYREIERSKPAPQGICVLNSAGKVLSWALMFEDDQSVPAFLDHCQERFSHYPDAKQPVAAERYLKFPGAKLDNVADTRNPLPLIDRHAKGKYCPAVPPLLPGTVVARLFGRVLDKDGKPVAETVRQEHYVEDRFEIPVAVQNQLATTLAAAAAERFRLPDNLARLLVSHAYLGQLDVNPVDAPSGKGTLKKCTFWGQRVGDTSRQPTRIRIEGESEAAGVSSPGQGGDGRLWEHEVRLTWEGWIDMDANRILHLVLSARGFEKLRWANGRLGPWAEPDVSHLPGGHPIDLFGGVRYGVIGEPAAHDQVAVDAPPGLAGLPVGPVPAEARRQLVQALGPAFLIFRDTVQEELRLSAAQTEKVSDRLAVTIQDAMAFFQRIDGVKPEERENELQSYRRTAQEQVGAFLTQTLKPEQRKRLRELELQQDGAFALGQPAIADELEISADQRSQFASVVQEMQQKLQGLLEEAQAAGKPEEVPSQLMKLRQEHEAKIEALLTEAQRMRWQQLLGQPFDLRD